MSDRLLTAWSAVTDPLVIVLDDMHHLRTPEITEDLGFVVEHLPGGSRMLLTSRADPHLPVSRWRGRGWLAEFGQRDLAFTLPETAELFTALGEHRLAASEVERLWRHTEGWVAGLRLAAAGLKDRADVPAAVAEFSGRTPVVADLLADELLHRAPRSCRSSCCGRRSPRSWMQSCATHCRGAATAPTCSGGWRPTCSS